MSMVVFIRLYLQLYGHITISRPCTRSLAYKCAGLNSDRLARSNLRTDRSRYGFSATTLPSFQT